MRALVAAFLALLLAAGVARADERPRPSFDCEKAKAPIEVLICTDAALAALDEALGRAFQARRSAASGAARDKLVGEQRAWLGQRTKGCALPADAENDLAGRWRALPCLIGLYRERVAALGGAAPALPTPGADSDLHPFCLEPFWSVAGGDRKSMSEVDLALCRRGTAHIPIERNAAVRFADRLDLRVGPSGYFGYRPVGTLDGGAEVYALFENGGGTGQFSALIALTRAGERLRAGKVVGFGDRCNGGLGDATMAGPRTVRAEGRVTVAALADLAATAREIVDGKKPTEPAPKENLADCAVCCAAAALLDTDMISGRHELAGAVIDEDVPAESCFSGVVKALAPKPPAILGVAQLARLDRDYRQRCAKR